MPLVHVIDPPYKVAWAPSLPGQLLLGAGMFGGYGSVCGCGNPPTSLLPEMVELAVSPEAVLVKAVKEGA